jgi:glycosyltransferase involved in cell wall biosynthesis
MTIPESVSIRDAIKYRFGCRRIIAAAHCIKKDLVARAGVSDSRIDVVGEGANLEEFHPGWDGGGFRAEFKIPPKSPLFGVIAMLRPEKGQRTFIKAAAKVLSLVSDARFVIVGGVEDLTLTGYMKKSAERSGKAPPRHYHGLPRGSLTRDGCPGLRCCAILG